MNGLVLTALAWLLAGSATATTGSCTCVVALEDGGWCGPHQVGYIAGVEITSEHVFEALDAHGHEIDPEFISCERCIAARATDGFCEEHSMGWVDDLAYLSKLTYHVARGKQVHAEQLDCPICRRHASSHGWCDTCGKGRLHHVEVSDRASYDELIAAHAVLSAAQRTLARCELCAAALVSNGRCPICKIAYRDGKPVPVAP